MSGFIQAKVDTITNKTLYQIVLWRSWSGVKSWENGLIQENLMIGLPSTPLFKIFQDLRTHTPPIPHINLRNHENTWHYNQFLTLYPVNFTIWNSTPSQM